MHNQPINVAALVAERSKILEWLKPAQEREMEIRRLLASHFFPSPNEGTNRIEKDGYKIVLNHNITRKLDETALDSVMPQLPEELRNIGILVNYKPALVMAGYRSLTEEQRRIFDQALEIKEGAPTLDIVPLEKPVEDSKIQPDGTYLTKVRVEIENKDLEKSFKRVEKVNAKKNKSSKKGKK